MGLSFIRVLKMLLVKPGRVNTFASSATFDCLAVAATCRI